MRKKYYVVMHDVIFLDTDWDKNELVKLTPKQAKRHLEVDRIRPLETMNARCRVYLTEINPQFKV